MGDNVAVEDGATEEAPEMPMPTPDAPMEEQGAAFRFFLSLGNGVLMNNNGFASAADAYLNAAGTVDLAPGDYVFSVDYEVCPPNLPQDLYFPALLPEACRTFTVGASGLITAGAAVAEAEGQACTHATSIDAITGGMTIGIAPFENHRLRCGPARVRVREAGLPFNDPSATILFFDFGVPQPPPPVNCGNGVCEAPEQCDDGNHHDGDGCSSSCTLE